MIHFWQHLPYHLNPVLFEIGPFSVRWYWLMYLVGWSVVYGLVRWRIKKGEWRSSGGGEKKEKQAAKRQAEPVLDALFWMFLGLVVGGRLGYFLFYGLGDLLQDPLMLINPFTLEGGQWHFKGLYGMSYHGGLIGVILAFLIYVKKTRLPFWRTADFIIPAIPLGFLFGRIGNFLNGELFGRMTQKAWGMYFPRAYYQDGGSFLRQPSQLYEALGEGLLLFLALWTLRKRGEAKTGLRLRSGQLVALYLMGYGLVRFLIEFVREPDEQLGFVLGGLTMGQLLCLLMIGAGVVIWEIRRKVSK